METITRLSRLADGVVTISEAATVLQAATEACYATVAVHGSHALRAALEERTHPPLATLCERMPDLMTSATYTHTLEQATLLLVRGVQSLVREKAQARSILRAWHAQIRRLQACQSAEDVNAVLSSGS